MDVAIVDRLQRMRCPKPVDLPATGDIERLPYGKR
jgi:hypothetical protein